MTTRKPIRLALLGFACLLSAACATTSYSRSGVAAVPPGVKGQAGSNASVEIEGLKVRLESLDYARREDPIPSFGLRLVFDPRELGYSFDPAQVVLRDESGTSWRPRVSGPETLVCPSCNAAPIFSRVIWKAFASGSVAARRSASSSVPDQSVCTTSK